VLVRTGMHDKSGDSSSTGGRAPVVHDRDTSNDSSSDSSSDDSSSDSSDGDSEDSDTDDTNDANADITEHGQSTSNKTVNNSDGNTPRKPSFLCGLHLSY
jgi:hypothetical protein